jgi:hypothetical protein
LLFFDEVVSKGGGLFGQPGNSLAMDVLEVLIGFVCCLTGDSNDSTLA